jgi:hypothetical protein
MSMAKPERPIPPQVLAEPLTRPKRLAEKMARMLNNEDVSDVAIALALLTSGVVNHYAEGPAKADELVNVIRKLEDRLLARSLEAGDVKLQ